MIGEFFIIKSKIRSIVKANFANDNEKVLDLGCGDDPYYHKNINGDIVSFDLRKTKKTKVVGHANSLPFKKNSFDSVICINSFYYFDDPFKSSKEVARILKKKGKLVLMMPFIYPVHDAPTDKYRFTEYGIKQLLKDEFEIEHIQSIGGIFNLKAVFLHSIIKGSRFMMPRFFSILLSILLYPFYIIAQLISLLDYFDRTRRWPTYYCAIAYKR